MYIFFFNQKAVYEMRISDWNSDVCSSDLLIPNFVAAKRGQTVEAQVQYGPYLKVAELVGFAFEFTLDGLDQPDERRNFRYRPLTRQQGFTRSHGAGRSTDGADHLIKIRDGEDTAEQELRPQQPPVQ